MSASRATFTPALCGEGSLVAEHYDTQAGRSGSGVVSNRRTALGLGGICPRPVPCRAIHGREPVPQAFPNNGLQIVLAGEATPRALLRSSRAPIHAL